MSGTAWFEFGEKVLLAVVPLGALALGAYLESRREDTQFARERKTTLRDHRRTKLEELYQAVEHQRSAVSSSMIGALSIAGGMGAPQEVVKHDTSKLAMLTDIYAPSARSKLDEMEATFKVYGEKMLRLVPDPKCVAALQAAHESVGTFQTAAKELQSAIAKLAREQVEN